MEKNYKELLAKPLPPESIKAHPTKSYLSTIKAVYVTERLTEVFGVGGWSLKTEVLHWDKEIKKNSKGNEYVDYTVMSKTIIEIPIIGAYYECVAGSNNEDLGDAAKGATTDAITKISSYLGIGIDVFKGLKSEIPKSTKEPEAKKIKPWLNPGTPEFEAAKAEIKGGKTLDQIKEVYLIAKKNEELLLK